MDPQKTNDASFLFVDSLDQYRDRICVRTASQTWTYGDVLDLGEQILGDDLGRKLVFIEASNTVELVAAYVASLRRHHVVHLLDPSRPDVTEQLVDQYQPNLLLRCPGPDWERIVINDDPLDLHPDVSVLLSTSGSTGSSKFVKLSRHNVESNTRSIIEYLGLDGSDRAGMILKPFYSYGFSVINTHLAVGGSLYFTDSTVQHSGFWSEVAEQGVTNLAGVPYTFESIVGTSVPWDKLTSLKFMTQAGGRLSPELVRHFSQLGIDHGWKFFVMYGQTEGGPRLAYLPPDQALQHPNAIGVPVPGGKLEIVDDDRNPIVEAEVEGELVYTGPNVMVGYATSPTELATKEHIAALYTGDMASRNKDGLFVITGRRSRFIKPMAARISLDELEAALSTPERICAATGDDQHLVVGFEAEVDASAIKIHISEQFGVPEKLIFVESGQPIPRLSNGKTDYRSLKDNALSTASQPGVHGFLQLVAKEFWSILTGQADQVMSVTHAFSLVFDDEDLAANSTFLSLNGDSLNHVELSVHLEDYLGFLPISWHEKTINELEQNKVQQRETADL